MFPKPTLVADLLLNLATSTRDLLSIVSREATPAQSRSWTGQVHMQLPSWGWQVLMQQSLLVEGLKSPFQFWTT